MCEGGSRNRRAPDELGSDAAAEGPRVVCYYNKATWLQGLNKRQVHKHTLDLTRLSSSIGFSLGGYSVN